MRPLVVGIFFLLLLTGGAAFGVNKKVGEERLARYEPRLLEAIHNLQEARSLRDLNDIRSRELIRKAKAIADQLRGEGVKDKRLQKLQEELGVFLPKILGEYKVSPHLLLDLSFVLSGFTVEAVSQEEDLVLALDKKSKILAQFSFDGGGMLVFGGEGIPQAQLTALGAGRAFVLDGQRLVEVTREGAQTVILPEGTWEKITGVAWFGKSLYLLDTGNGRIWRYTWLGDKFSQGTSWAKEAGTGFSDAVSLSIDGSIWLLSEGGEIRKYMEGYKTNFNLHGLEDEIKEGVQIVTYAGAANLYVLDRGGRVVVFDKEGNYRAQYLWDGLKNAQGIAVSEEKKKLLIFIDSKVYNLELQN